MNPELQKLAEQAGIHFSPDGSHKAIDWHNIEELILAVAADCAKLTPNGLNVCASWMPHKVWEAYQQGIRTKYGIK